MSARRWVDEQKRHAFDHSSSLIIQFNPSNLSHLGFDEIPGYPPVLDDEVQEYNQDLEHLERMLGDIEEYIHIAFASLRKEEVVRRLFTMVS